MIVRKEKVSKYTEKLKTHENKNIIKRVRGATKIILVWDIGI